MEDRCDADADVGVAAAVSAVSAFFSATVAAHASIALRSAKFG